MWIQSRTFILFAVCLSVLAIVHVVAIEFFLYWTYSWLDIFMHGLGGMVVALGFLTFYPSYARGAVKKGLLITVLAVFTVGLLWEIFELVSALEGFAFEDYIGDTTLDLIMDIVGACIGYWCARASVRHETIPLS